MRKDGEQEAGGRTPPSCSTGVLSSPLQGSPRLTAKPHSGRGPLAWGEGGGVARPMPRPHFLQGKIGWIMVPTSFKRSEGFCGRTLAELRSCCAHGGFPRSISLCSCTHHCLRKPEKPKHRRTHMLAGLPRPLSPPISPVSSPAPPPACREDPHRHPCLHLWLARLSAITQRCSLKGLRGSSAVPQSRRSPK